MFRGLFYFIVDKKYRPIVVAFFVLLVTGTVIFHFLEGWKWLDAFYFSVITLATVGYGDFTPKTDLGKIFTMFYIISGIGIFLAFIQTYFEFLREKRRGK
jgi:TRAP-type C4-dicarboxylate transport system permease small subunit